MMKKLLLADDSITIQKVVGIILSTEGYQLEITDDGDRAFTKALEEVPDLVIADISMPGKDGFELCRAIKSEPTLANTSVLLLPGVFDHFDETKAGDVCADGWLTKPFESQALLDKVAQLLEAEPVQIAGTAVPEDEELSLETPVEATEVDIDTTVSEEILGLDVVDALASPAESVEEESPEDIWDAVSFAEEDLQQQVEPTQENSADAVSLAAEVIDPSARDEVVEPAAEEPVLSTSEVAANEIDPPVVEVENDLIVKETSALEDTEDFQPEPFVGGDLGEVAAAAGVDLNEQYEASSEMSSPPPVEEAEPIDFSVFGEDEDGLQSTPSADDADLTYLSSGDNDEEPLELIEELEEAPVSVAEESDSTAVESEEALELIADDFVDQNTEVEVVEEKTSFAARDEEDILELQEEESLGEPVPIGEDLNEDDGIIDLLEENIVAFESAEEPESDLQDEITDLAEEDIELTEEDIELTEEDIELTEEEPDLVDEENIELTEEEPDLVDEEIELTEEEIELVDEEPELIAGSESLSSEDKDEVFYFVASASDSHEASTTMAAAGAVEGTPAEQIEQQLRELSEDELKDVVSKVAGPIIEKLAGEMLERIAWEVVPDLAEAMIGEEIRKIKEGV